MDRRPMGSGPGEPDPTKNCPCEFRRGYDWSAFRALAEGGWVAWNLEFGLKSCRGNLHQGVSYW